MTTTAEKARRKRDSVIGDAETTIFSSRDTMTSEERTAVKKGEKRGERVTEAESPEKYNNIGSFEQRIATKNMAYAKGLCKKCKHGIRNHSGYARDPHCKLSEQENCVQ